jgi:hypothetical protein
MPTFTNSLAAAATATEAEASTPTETAAELHVAARAAEAAARIALDTAQSALEAVQKARDAMLHRASAGEPVGVDDLHQAEAEIRTAEVPVMLAKAVLQGKTHQANLAEIEALRAVAETHQADWRAALLEAYKRARAADAAVAVANDEVSLLTNALFDMSLATQAAHLHDAEVKRIQARNSELAALQSAEQPMAGKKIRYISFPQGISATLSSPGGGNGRVPLRLGTATADFESAYAEFRGLLTDAAAKKAA